MRAAPFWTRIWSFSRFPGGGWNLAWGPNTANGTNEQLHIVTGATKNEPGQLVTATQAWRRQLNDGAIEFWLPLMSEQPPAFEAWLRLTARRWNAPT